MVAVVVNGECLYTGYTSVVAGVGGGEWWLWCVYRVYISFYNCDNKASNSFWWATCLDTQSFDLRIHIRMLSLFLMYRAQLPCNLPVSNSQLVFLQIYVPKLYFSLHHSTSMQESTKNVLAYTNDFLRYKQVFGIADSTLPEVQFSCYPLSYADSALPLPVAPVSSASDSVSFLGSIISMTRLLLVYTHILPAMAIDLRTICSASMLGWSKSASAAAVIDGTC